MRTFKKVLNLFSLTVLGFAAYGAYYGYVALKADHTLYFGMLTCHAMNDYVKSHDGKWPRSWEEFRQGTREMEPYGTDDVAIDRLLGNMQKRVTIDFTTSELEIAQSTVENFNAIVPVERPDADWNPNEYWEVSRLLETMRSYHLKNTTPDNVPVESALIEEP